MPKMLLLNVVLVVSKADELFLWTMEVVVVMESWKGEEGVVVVRGSRVLV